MDAKFRRKNVPPGVIPNTVRAKWSDEVLEEGFVPFPKKLVRTMSSLFDYPDGALDISVILSVVDFKRPDQIREPSLDYLAFTAGISQELLVQRLQFLKQRGLLHPQGTREQVNINLDGLFTKIQELSRKQTSSSAEEEDMPLQDLGL